MFVGLSHLRNGVRRNFMALRIQILNLAVVRPFVGHIEGGAQRTPVWIDASFLEQIGVELLVEVVDGIIEGQQHQLGHGFDRHVAFMIIFVFGHYRDDEGDMKMTQFCVCDQD